jgi:hypothetical protein
MIQVAEELACDSVIVGEMFVKRYKKVRRKMEMNMMESAKRARRAEIFRPAVRRKV